MKTEKPIIIALDLEGTLAPEMWIMIAEGTGIEELRLTTRDIPDFKKLMARRIEILKEHGITYARIQEILQKVAPFEGAPAFLEWIRTHEHMQPVIISDTFYQFAKSLMEKLGDPFLLCNTLHIGDDGFVSGYSFRHPCEKPKKEAVQAFQDQGFYVFAAGDSYNDIAMFEVADAGVLFRAPEKIEKEFPHLTVVHEYPDLEKAIREAVGA